MAGEVNPTERLAEFHSAIYSTGIAFNPHGINEARLHQTLFEGIADIEGDEIQLFVDQMVEEELKDEQPGDEFEYDRIEDRPTDIALRDRSTMRAVLLSVLETPSDPVVDHVNYRYTQLLDRDFIFALPFAGRLKDFSGRLDQYIVDRLGNTLGNDIEIDKRFLRGIGNYAHQPWARDYAIRAAHNPTAFDNYHWLQRQPWFPEVKFVGQTVVNSIQVLARRPRDVARSLDMWRQDGVADPYKDGYQADYRVWIPPTSGDPDYSLIESMTESLVRRGSPHNVKGYEFAVVGCSGGD